MKCIINMQTTCFKNINIFKTNKNYTFVLKIFYFIEINYNYMYSNFYYCLATTKNQKIYYKNH
jgi:hypothetical protein